PPDRACLRRVQPVRPLLRQSRRRESLDHLPAAPLLVARSLRRGPPVSRPQAALRRLTAPLFAKPGRQSAPSYNRSQMLSRAALAMAAVSIVLTGCAHKRRTRTVPPTTPRNAAPAVVGSTETGIASWYGKPYDGRRAADGEIYDMETLVAAHRTLPFNTWVRVLNLQNNKTVDVRIIDLSHAAAQAIDMAIAGIARVRLEIISAPASEAASAFVVQVGAYLDRA